MGRAPEYSTNLWTQTPEWMLSDELDGDLYMVGVGGDPILFLPDGRVVRFDVSENTWSLLNAIEQWRALPEPVLSGVAMFSGDDYLLVSKSPHRLVVGQ